MRALMVLLALIVSADAMAADRSATVFGGKFVHEAFVAITPPGWEEIFLASPDPLAAPNGTIYADKAAHTEIEFGHSVAPQTVKATDLLDKCGAFGNSCEDCVALHMAPAETAPLGPALPEARRMLVCQQMRGASAKLGFVEVWSFTARDRDVFYSRFTWFVPAFTTDAAPLSNDEIARGMKMALFWVCDPSGKGRKCPDPVGAIAATVLPP